MKVKDLYKISKGKKAPELDFNSGLRYIQIEDLRTDDNLKFTDPKAKAVICEKSDILIAWDGANAGTIGYGLEGAIGSTIAKLSPKNEKVDSDYAGRFLQSKFNYLRDTATGATIPHISRPVLENLQIPLPPLPVQKRIAEILDLADAYRQKTKALIDKYDELAQSIFLEMFGDPVTNPKGWDQKRLGQLIQITSSKRIFKDDYVNEGIPFYRTKEIVELATGKEISLELFISEEKYELIKSKFDIPKVGDILISAVGTIGVMWAVNHQEPFYFKDGNLIWMKSSKLSQVDPTYLRMTLEYLIENEKYKLAEGGAYNALTIAKLKEFNVLMAPFVIQEQFSKRIESLTNQKKLTTAASEMAEELFQSLLQKAFKGELIDKEDLEITKELGTHV
jgi:type I restriction enzyme S subunit